MERFLSRGGFFRFYGGKSGASKARRLAVMVAAGGLKSRRFLTFNGFSARLYELFGLMPVLRSLTLCVILSFLLALPSPVHAAFLFCNKTKQLIEGAFGYRETTDWISEGWWQIQPGQCARVFSKPLTQRFYFYFARVLNPTADSQSQTVWSGKSLFCIDNKAFKIQGYDQCEKKGYRQQGFQQVDVGNDQRDYTLTFQDDGGR